MTEIKPRFEIPLRIAELSSEAQKQFYQAQEQLNAQDHRKVLSIQLKMTRKVLKAIETRLESTPQDTHQLYLQEVHLHREKQLLNTLRLANTDDRYQRLETWVNQKVQQLDPEASNETIHLSAEEHAAQARLREEQKAWQSLIQKVRERLVKKPGDPKLVQLLAEHQNRLLRLQEQERQQQNKIEEEALVLTSFESSLESAGAEASTERVRLLREIAMREALCEKTRQRLFDKPELLHLNALIAQHESHIKALRENLQAL